MSEPSSIPKGTPHGHTADSQGIPKGTPHGHAADSQGISKGTPSGYAADSQGMPMAALREMVILPEMVVHFDVSRERSIHAVAAAMEEEGQKIFLTAQRDGDVDKPERKSYMRQDAWRLSSR